VLRLEREGGFFAAGIVLKISFLVVARPDAASLGNRIVPVDADVPGGVQRGCLIAHVPTTVFADHLGKIGHEALVCGALSQFTASIGEGGERKRVPAGAGNPCGALAAFYNTPGANNWCEPSLSRIGGRSTP
jgi:hypothetical protein